MCWYIRLRMAFLIRTKPGIFVIVIIITITIIVSYS